MLCGVLGRTDTQDSDVLWPACRLHHGLYRAPVDALWIEDEPSLAGIVFGERDQQFVKARASLPGAGIAGNQPVGTKFFDVPFPGSGLADDLVRVVDDRRSLAFTISGLHHL